MIFSGSPGIDLGCRGEESPAITGIGRLTRPVASPMRRAGKRRAELKNKRKIDARNSRGLWQSLPGGGRAATLRYVRAIRFKVSMVRVRADDRRGLGGLEAKVALS